MKVSPSPFEIIEALYPTLVESARYSTFIQHRIEALEDKEATNIFAAALSDADGCVQNHVEVALLGRFPHVPMFGEEWKASRNTKYLASTSFVEGYPYLVTLDPIDGTRPYLDNHELYQIILTVISKDRFEAAIVLFPAFNEYVYAVNGKGAFHGSLDEPLAQATPWKAGNAPRTAYIAGAFDHARGLLGSSFEKVWSSSDYSKDTKIVYSSALLLNKLCGSIFDFAQIIDGAAIAFVAGEMGYIVRTFDGKPMPPLAKYPDMVLPGLIVAETEKIAELFTRAVGRE